MNEHAYYDKTQMGSVDIFQNSVLICVCVCVGGGGGGDASKLSVPFQTQLG